jgi:GrpB-like predicted nucleotidyltransferase (UPF0157 family)
VIDIALVVADSSDEAGYVPSLKSAGYRLRIREPDSHEHPLRPHDDDRALYEGAKRELAAREWRYVQNDADAKSEVIEAILARAKAA